MEIFAFLQLEYAKMQLNVDNPKKIFPQDTSMKKSVDFDITCEFDYLVDRVLI